MDGKKITLQNNGQMESYVAGTKNSPKDGELNGRHENNSPKEWTDGKLNGRHERNWPKGWTDGELNGWQKNNFPRDG